jgi:hypothetical protein
VSELSATGWQVADEFYTGLAMAGPEFSQEKVVAALNTVTDYSDNGFIKPLDWTKYHIDPTTHPEARATRSAPTTRGWRPASSCRCTASPASRGCASRGRPNGRQPDVPELRPA